ncbi:mucin-2-like [Crassostrea angulata]|uniref:mucin-2-like n=1 Tax=Magallana angulata TaxID=2784310 RepID=UPI0022B1D53A|nr:mucin-2-like [Crassostrea angulata]
MARRSSVREDRHFLVRYLCDDNFQVRSRAYFRCESDITITVGEEYDVQWGRAKEVDRAVVLDSGSDQELRVKMRELETRTEPSSPTPPASPLSPSPPPSPPTPAPKRQKTTMSFTKSGKPRASMITSGSPPTVNEQTLPIAVPATVPTGPQTPPVVMPASVLTGLQTPPVVVPASVPTGPQTPPVVVPASVPTGPQTPPVVVPASVPTGPQTPPVVVPASVPTGPQTPPVAVPASVPIGLQTPRASTPVVRFRPHRLSTSDSDSLVGGLLKEVSDLRKSVDIVNKKIDATNRRTTHLETLLTTAIANTNIIIDIIRRQSSDNTLTQLNSAMHSQTSAEETPSSTPTTEGIPPEFKIDDSELRVLVRESRNAGNFAVNLTRKLFPELFGEGQLRYEYNWYGGGKLAKKELDPVRKQVVKQYVVYFFPEFQSHEAWRERQQLVPKINECLRRNDKRLKRKSIVIPQLTECHDDVFDFVD